MKFDNRTFKTILNLDERFVYKVDMKPFSIAYAKGNKRERYSPITGNRYPVGKNHESADLDYEDDESEPNKFLKLPNQRYKKGNRRNDQGKTFKRSPSPYSKNEKGKGKVNPNPNYKGRNYDENYQKNKKDNEEPKQSTSKE